MMSFNIDDLLPYLENEQHELGIGELTFLLSGENTPEMASTLYTNRGVTYWMSGNVKEAYEDFENSVKYNHLNYVGYYNLHTFYAFSGNNFQALQSLCCAISCLYLMRGQKNCN